MILRIATTARVPLSLAEAGTPEKNAARSFKRAPPKGEPIADAGCLELCARDFLCGWIYDAQATHVDVAIDEARHQTHTLFSDSSRIDAVTGLRRRYFVMPFAERLPDGARVAVRLGGRDLVGSPMVMTAAKQPTEADQLDLRLHVEAPGGSIQTRLCTIAGWMTLHAGTRDFCLLVNGSPQDGFFTVRPDVADHFDTPCAIGWEFTCDIAALEAKGATSLCLACEVDGTVVGDHEIAFDLSPCSGPRPPLHLFMHVPKTAGTSLTAAIIKQSALTTHWLYHRGLFSIAAQEAALSPRAFHDLDLVGGHFTYGLHQRVERPCRYVTVLREPLAFLQSYFFYRKKVQRFTPFRDLDIFAAMERRLDHYLDNCFTRCFAGMSPERPVDAEALAEAKANMERHFAFVGLFERMEESVARLSILLGVTLNVGRENYTPLSTEAKALDMPILARRAAPYIVYDEQLYQHAQRLFWSQSAAKGTSCASAT